MAYVSPAAAFSGTIEDALLRREAKKRQDLLDQHQIRLDEANLKLRQDELDQRREDRKLAEQDKKEAQKDKIATAKQQRYEKIAGGMLPGDVVTPDIAQMAVETGNQGDVANPPQQFTDEQGKVTEGTPAMAGVMAQPPTVPDLAANKIPLRFMGSPAQRQAEVKKKETEAYVNSLPAGPLKDAALFRLRTGGTEPANILKAPDETQDVVYVSQDRKSFSRMEPGKGLVATTGPFKKGTHFVEAPQPPSQLPIVIQTDSGPMAFNRGAGTAAPILGPDKEPVQRPLSGATQAMVDGAKMLAPHIPRVDQLAQELDKRGLFGPIMSRVREAATKVGTIDAGDFEKSSAQLQQFASEFNAAVDADPKLSTDALVGQFATELGLLASGAGRVHGGARGGGSIQMIDYMKSLLGSNSTYQMFHGRMTGLDNYIGGYAKGPPKTTHGTADTPETKVFTSGPYKGKTGTRQPDGSWEVEVEAK